MPPYKTSFNIEYLPFDTEIFSIKCGKLTMTSGGGSGDDLDNVISRARAAGYHHIVAKAPSGNISFCGILEKNGFRYAGSSLDMKKTVAKDAVSSEGVTLFNEKDAKDIIDITIEAFSSGTRFHNETRFSPDHVREFHRRWIVNLINDKEVMIFTHSVNGRISGYITVDVGNAPSTKGNIGLFAIAERYRGIGIGSKLLSAAEGRLSGYLNALTVTTESSNYPALKAYSKHGFLIKEALTIFHLNIYLTAQKSGSCVTENKKSA